MLYDKVRKYYQDNGRKLTKAEYFELSYQRFNMMYKSKTFKRTSEHPLNSTNVKLKLRYSKLCKGKA